MTVTNTIGNHTTNFLHQPSGISNQTSATTVFSKLPENISNIFSGTGSAVSVTSSLSNTGISVAPKVPAHISRLADTLVSSAAASVASNAGWPQSIDLSRSRSTAAAQSSAAALGSSAQTGAIAAEGSRPDTPNELAAESQKFSEEALVYNPLTANYEKLKPFNNNVETPPLRECERAYLGTPQVWIEDVWKSSDKFAAAIKQVLKKEHIPAGATPRQYSDDEIARVYEEVQSGRLHSMLAKGMLTLIPSAITWRQVGESLLQDFGVTPLSELLSRAWNKTLHAQPGMLRNTQVMKHWQNAGEFLNPEERRRWLGMPESSWGKDAMQAAGDVHSAVLNILTEPLPAEEKEKKLVGLTISHEIPQHGWGANAKELRESVLGILSAKLASPDIQEYLEKLPIEAWNLAQVSLREGQAGDSLSNIIAGLLVAPGCSIGTLNNLVKDDTSPMSFIKQRLFSLTNNYSKARFMEILQEMGVSAPVFVRAHAVLDREDGDAVLKELKNDAVRTPAAIKLMDILTAGVVPQAVIDRVAGQSLEEFKKDVLACGESIGYKPQDLAQYRACDDKVWARVQAEVAEGCLCSSMGKALGSMLLDQQLKAVRGNCLDERGRAPRSAWGKDEQQFARDIKATILGQGDPDHCLGEMETWRARDWGIAWQQVSYGRDLREPGCERSRLILSQLGAKNVESAGWGLNAQQFVKEVKRRMMRLPWDVWHKADAILNECGPAIFKEIQSQRLVSPKAKALFGMLDGQLAPRDVWGETTKVLKEKLALACSDDGVLAGRAEEFKTLTEKSFKLLLSEANQGWLSSDLAKKWLGPLAGEALDFAKTLDAKDASERATTSYALSMAGELKQLKQQFKQYVSDKRPGPVIGTASGLDATAVTTAQDQLKQSILEELQDELTTLREDKAIPVAFKTKAMHELKACLSIADKLSGEEWKSILRQVEGELLLTKMAIRLLKPLFAIQRAIDLHDYAQINPGFENQHEHPLYGDNQKFDAQKNCWSAWGLKLLHAQDTLSGLAGPRGWNLPFSYPMSHQERRDLRQRAFIEGLKYKARVKLAMEDALILTKLRIKEQGIASMGDHTRLNIGEKELAHLDSRINAQINRLAGETVEILAPAGDFARLEQLVDNQFRRQKNKFEDLFEDTFSTILMLRHLNKVDNSFDQFNEDVASPETTSLPPDPTAKAPEPPHHAPIEQAAVAAHYDPDAEEEIEADEGGNELDSTGKTGEVDSGSTSSSTPGASESRLATVARGVAGGVVGGLVAGAPGALALGLLSLVSGVGAPPVEGQNESTDSLRGKRSALVETTGGPASNSTTSARQVYEQVHLALNSANASEPITNFKEKFRASNNQKLLINMLSVELSVFANKRPVKILNLSEGQRIGVYVQSCILNSLNMSGRDFFEKPVDEQDVLSAKGIVNCFGAENNDRANTLLSMLTDSNKHSKDSVRTEVNRWLSTLPRAAINSHGIRQYFEAKLNKGINAKVNLWTMQQASQSIDGATSHVSRSTQPPAQVDQDAGSRAQSTFAGLSATAAPDSASSNSAPIMHTATNQTASDSIFEQLVQQTEALWEPRMGSKLPDAYYIKSNLTDGTVEHAVILSSQTNNGMQWWLGKANRAAGKIIELKETPNFFNNTLTARLEKIFGKGQPKEINYFVLRYLTEDDQARAYDHNIEIDNPRIPDAIVSPFRSGRLQAEYAFTGKYVDSGGEERTYLAKKNNEKIISDVSEFNEQGDWSSYAKNQSKIFFGRDFSFDQRPVVFRGDHFNSKVKKYISEDDRDSVAFAIKKYMENNCETSSGTVSCDGVFVSFKKINGNAVDAFKTKKLLSESTTSATEVTLTFERLVASMGSARHLIPTRDRVVWEINDPTLKSKDVIWNDAKSLLTEFHRSTGGADETLAKDLIIFKKKIDDNYARCYPSSIRSETTANALPNAADIDNYLSLHARELLEKYAGSNKVIHFSDINSNDGKRSAILGVETDNGNVKWVRGEFDKKTGVLVGFNEAPNFGGKTLTALLKNKFGNGKLDRIYYFSVWYMGPDDRRRLPKKIHVRTDKRDCFRQFPSGDESCTVQEIYEPLDPNSQKADIYRNDKIERSLSFIGGYMTTNNTRYPLFVKLNDDLIASEVNELENSFSSFDRQQMNNYVRNNFNSVFGRDFELNEYPKVYSSDWSLQVDARVAEYDKAAMELELRRYINDNCQAVMHVKSCEDISVYYEKINGDAKNVFDRFLNRENSLEILPSNSQEWPHHLRIVDQTGNGSTLVDNSEINKKIAEIKGRRTARLHKLFDDVGNKICVDFPMMSSVKAKIAGPTALEKGKAWQEISKDIQGITKDFYKKGFDRRLANFVSDLCQIEFNENYDKKFIRSLEPLESEYVSYKATANSTRCDTEKASDFVTTKVKAFAVGLDYDRLTTEEKRQQTYKWIMQALTDNPVKDLVLSLHHKLPEKTQSEALQDAQHILDILKLPRAPELSEVFSSAIRDDIKARYATAPAFFREPPKTAHGVLAVFKADLLPTDAVESLFDECTQWARKPCDPWAVYLVLVNNVGHGNHTVTDGAPLRAQTQISECLQQAVQQDKTVNQVRQEVYDILKRDVQLLGDFKDSFINRLLDSYAILKGKGVFRSAAHLSSNEVVAAAVLHDFQKVKTERAMTDLVNREFPASMGADEMEKKIKSLISGVLIHRGEDGLDSRGWSPNTNGIIREMFASIPGREAELDAQYFHARNIMKSKFYPDAYWVFRPIVTADSGLS